MRDILISSAICIACLVVALVSQLVSPSTVVAAPPAAAPAAEAVRPAVAAPLELDPDDPNPSLFTMAADAAMPADGPLAQSGGASALGGELVAPTERVTESGLRITDLEVGDGAEAVSGRTVAVNYRGTLQNGREFDSSYGRGPFRFPLGAGRVIRGWDEGVAGMKVGGHRTLIIPPQMGYGAAGAGGVIPPNAVLVFDVELLDVQG